MSGSHFSDVPELVRGYLVKNVVISAISIFFSILVLLFVLFTLSNESKDELSVKQPTRVQFCSLVVEEIFNGRYDKRLLSTSLFEGLTKKKWKLRYDEVVLLHIEKDICTVITRLNDDLMRFDFLLDKFSSYEFGYIATEFNEKRLKRSFKL